MMKMRSVPFLDITRHRVIIPYRSFFLKSVYNYHSILHNIPEQHGSKILFCKKAVMQTTILSVILTRNCNVH